MEYKMILSERAEKKFRARIKPGENGCEIWTGLFSQAGSPTFWWREPGEEPLSVGVRQYLTGIYQKPLTTKCKNRACVAVAHIIRWELPPGHMGSQSPRRQLAGTVGSGSWRDT